ncbi:leuA, partial [Acrasis kona]
VNHSKSQIIPLDNFNNVITFQESTIWLWKCSYSRPSRLISVYRHNSRINGVDLTYFNPNPPNLIIKSPNSITILSITQDGEFKSHNSINGRFPTASCMHKNNMLIAWKNNLIHYTLDSSFQVIKESIIMEVNLSIIRHIKYSDGWLCVSEPELNYIKKEPQPIDNIFQNGSLVLSELTQESNSFSNQGGIFIIKNVNNGFLFSKTHYCDWLNAQSCSVSNSENDISQRIVSVCSVTDNWFYVYKFNCDNVVDVCKVDLPKNDMRALGVACVKSKVYVLCGEKCGSNSPFLFGAAPKYTNVCLLKYDFVQNISKASDSSSSNQDLKIVLESISNLNLAVKEGFDRLENVVLGLSERVNLLEKKLQS